MSLFLATLLPGLFLLVLGALFLANTPAVVSTFKVLPRSQTATWLFFGGGAALFLYQIAHLGEADFGEYKVYLFVFFALVAAGAFRYVPDFLAVRGLAILVLLTANPLLGAAYMEEPSQRKLMVGFVYVCIGLALYLGAVPYRLRDFFEWLYARPARAPVFGAGLLAYGLLLSIVAVSY